MMSSDPLYDVAATRQEFDRKVEKMGLLKPGGPQPWWVRALVRLLAKMAGTNSWPGIVAWIFTQTFKDNPESKELFLKICDHVLTVAGWVKQPNGKWLSVIKPMPGEILPGTPVVRQVQHANLCSGYEAVAKEIYFYMSAKAQAAALADILASPLIKETSSKHPNTHE